MKSTTAFVYGYVTALSVVLWITLVRNLGSATLEEQAIGLSLALSFTSFAYLAAFGYQKFFESRNKVNE